MFDVETRKESTLTSPFRQKIAGLAEIAYGWSPDGQAVISSSFRYRPGQISIAIVPLAAAPTAELAAKVVTSSAEYGLWNTRMSPDGRWICFNAAKEGTSRIAVVSSKGGDWTWITERTSFVDKPRWSADGRLIYFVSQEGGLGDVWGIEFDSAAGKPVGRPFALTKFTGPEEQIGDVSIIELGVSRGLLAIPLRRPTGNIHMIEHFKR